MLVFTDYVDYVWCCMYCTNPAFGCQILINFLSCLVNTRVQNLLTQHARNGDKCMLNHCLEWSKWVLTNFDHGRQWFTLTHLFHLRTRPQLWLLTVDSTSRLRGPVRLILCYTTPDIHCRDRRYKWDGGITFCSPNSVCHSVIDL